MILLLHPSSPEVAHGLAKLRVRSSVIREREDFAMKRLNGSRRVVRCRARNRKYACAFLLSFVQMVRMSFFHVALMRGVQSVDVDGCYQRRLSPASGVFEGRAFTVSSRLRRHLLFKELS